MSFLEPVPGYHWSPPGSTFSGVHQAVDIPAPCGQPVVAIADGVVQAAGWDQFTPYNLDLSGDGGGQIITLQHTIGQTGRTDSWHPHAMIGKRAESQYAHLSRIDVIVGQFVRGGQTIGAVGSTGHSTGCHLHFGFRVNGVWVDYQTVRGSMSLDSAGLTPKTGLADNARLSGPIQEAPKDPFGNKVAAYPLDAGKQCEPGYRIGTISPSIGGGVQWLFRPTQGDGQAVACLRMDLQPGDNANTATGQGLAAIAEGLQRIALDGALLLGLLALLILGAWALVKGGGGGGSVAVG